MRTDPQASFWRRHPLVKDALGLVVFVGCVILGTIFINTFLFRSFNVVGPSMEPTMHTDDRLIVNRLPVTWAQLQNQPYRPERGQVIVFRNPQFSHRSSHDEYVVKRVIAFAGERVTVKGGIMTVYNQERPNGFQPDADLRDQTSAPISGEVDTTVTAGTLFVVGDNRRDQFSCDSRDCMGTIPLHNVVGPVSVRFWPLNQIRSF